MMSREKMENMWAAGMKFTDSYWSMLKSAAESMSLWQEKSRDMMNAYMQGSKELFDEQMKWFDAAVMQANKGSQQMQMIMKEAFITAVENMSNPSFNPWMAWMKLANNK